MPSFYSLAKLHSREKEDLSNEVNVTMKLYKSHYSSQRTTRRKSLNVKRTLHSVNSTSLVSKKQSHCNITKSRNFSKSKLCSCETPLIKNSTKYSLKELGFQLHPNFITGSSICVLTSNPTFTEKEEASLVAEVDPYLSRRKYETSHWDHVITGYRYSLYPLLIPLLMIANL
jgi:hypothetical protein